jgi:hypothetical protein
VVTDALPHLAVLVKDKSSKHGFAWRMSDLMTVNCSFLIVRMIVTASALFADLQIARTHRGSSW